MKRKETNGGCSKCGSFRTIKESSRKYCCHNDAFKLMISPVNGEYHMLKNNDMHEKWNKKLRCKRYNEIIEESNDAENN